MSDMNNPMAEGGGVEALRAEMAALQARLAEANRLQRIAGRLGGWRVELSPPRLIWSPETAAIHGEPETIEPTLEQGLAYYAPEFQERIRQVFRRCAKNGDAFNELAQILTAQGQRVWVRSIGEAVRNDAGEIIAVEGAFQDISELVAARDAASTLDRRLSQTLENFRTG